MKPYRLIAPLALAFVALFVGAAPPAAHATTCRHADVVFYSTDTLRLAQRLTHGPVGVRGLLHLRDSRPPTARRAAASHRTGPLVRAELPRHAGDPARSVGDLGPGSPRKDVVRRGRRGSPPHGDGGIRRLHRATRGRSTRSGSPSTQQTAVDVFTNAGTARADLRDFVRGLYTGDAGMPPAPGLVFAADPPQVTSDLSQYKQQLEDFYGDSPFWTDMSAYVRFWAQETYADARSWGVAGSTLDDRATHLNDYFQHGLLLGEAGPGSTNAARSFLEAAYTPVGNAAYPLYRARAPARRHRLRLHEHHARADAELRLDADGRVALVLVLDRHRRPVRLRVVAEHEGIPLGSPAATYVSLADRIAGCDPRVRDRIRSAPAARPASGATAPSTERSSRTPGRRSQRGRRRRTRRRDRPSRCRSRRR